ncbi:uncharacterized protein LOC124941122 [Impatiens glandulifera]|uniref:uncharacterized protein LOC124941122 n=1 Tax=Impatiens glandulifera TaxID=253017 RepID=UPI001FB171A4|nr:uncharacterized protein LOC124941122 [Impatiens glandulifera]
MSSMPEPNHFSDYGFDPQIDFFQGLEASRRNRRDNSSNNNNNGMSRSVDSSFHFKLQKPISKDELRIRLKKQKQSKWWRNAFLFIRKGWDYSGCRPAAGQDHNTIGGVNNHALIWIGSTSPSPVFLTENSSTPEEEEEEEEIPYISLTAEPQLWRNSTSAMPLYLVT